MTKKVFYIDPYAGNDCFSGLDKKQPRKTYLSLNLQPGDAVLFKRGSILRGGLETCNGSKEGDIVYGAYGTGRKPVFLGSVPADGAENWTEERPAIWRFKGSFPSEVCNLIFNYGANCGNLRWKPEDLKCQGEWHYTGIGQNSEESDLSMKQESGAGTLYLFSASNPGLFYSSIECALWGNRKLVGGRAHIVLEDIAFLNAGVHGYQESHAHNIVIRNCEFGHIGGAVWSMKQKIRFGNAVEFWDGAQDASVENCIFSNIYDSGVTHQGGEESDMPERICFRNNLFINCGMAAYECRGPAGRAIYFEKNICVHTGGGFSLQGEEPPRRSEIYPQPMGHHVFIWLIGKNTQRGNIYIRDNVFYESPFGAAIYSLIDPQDEKKFFIDNNFYFQAPGSLHARMNGKTYTAEQFRDYQHETGQDRHSIMANP